MRRQPLWSIADSNASIREASKNTIRVPAARAAPIRGPVRAGTNVEVAGMPPSDDTAKLLRDTCEHFQGQRCHSWSSPRFLAPDRSWRTRFSNSLAGPVETPNGFRIVEGRSIGDEIVMRNILSRQMLHRQQQSGEL